MQASVTVSGTTATRREEETLLADNRVEWELVSTFSQTHAEPIHGISMRRALDDVPLVATASWDHTCKVRARGSPFSNFGWPVCLGVDMAFLLDIKKRCADGECARESLSEAVQVRCRSMLFLLQKNAAVASMVDVQASILKNDEIL